MQDDERYNVPVRATRAYMAGFGSSGSLLACAAVLFLLGSAIVAFNGWPQIAAPPASSSVVAAPLAATSHASPRLIHALAVTRRRVLATDVVSRLRSPAGGGGVRHVVLGRTVVRSTAGASPPSGASTGRGGGSTGAALPAACSGCVSHPAGSPNPVSTATSKLAQTVSKVGSGVGQVGNEVGQQITGLGNAASQPLSNVSPPVGSTVGAVGSTVGNTVSGTATTAGSVVSGVGNAPGGGH